MTSCPPLRNRGAALLQRKCACGRTPGPTGECEECRNERLQRKIANPKSKIRNESVVPPIVYEVLRSPDQPIDPGGTRAFTEPRFGHDFSRVPVHTPSVVEHRAYRFKAMIPRANASIFLDDSGQEGQRTAETAAAESETPMEEPTIGNGQRAAETAAGELKEGETVRLPDVEPPDIPAFTIVQEDPVNPTLDYSPHVERITLSNACPFTDHRVFGLTTMTPPSIVDVSVTPVLAWYYVDATVDQEIRFRVCDGVGPQGQVDITSENDANITKENYWEVAQDLTPDSTGVPPRKLFYANDLSLRHERFHVSEWVKVAEESMPDVQKRLSGKTTSRAFGVNFLLVDLSKQFNDVVNVKVAPLAEVHEYGDGKPSYLARSKAIIAKGDAGGYQKFDWKKGLP